MRAVRVHRFGGPETLSLERYLDQPRLGDLDILVRVRAASLNPVDAKIRDGGYPKIGLADLPYALGRDLAGEVLAVGAQMADVKPGDPILAHLGWDRGAWASRAVVRPGEWAIKPTALSWETAAAIPLVADTAWQGLFDHGELKAGQRVLIHAASGGVGQMAVQLAKAKGATVFATAGPDAQNLLRDLGADTPIDYRLDRFEDVATDLDLVFDLMGGETRARSWGLLKPGGRLATTVATGDVAAEGQARGGFTGIAYSAVPRGATLNEVARKVADGRLQMHIAKTFPLSRVAAAARFAEGDSPHGKVVLTV